MSLPFSQRSRTEPSRRVVIAGGAGLLAIVAAPAARATPKEMAEAIESFTKGAPVTEGRVRLDLPPLVENGNAVPLAVGVDSPMTAADHVSAIAVFNEKNPQPHIATVLLGPRAGRAGFATRIRLADSQHVVAVARMSDGSFWSASAEVVVTLAACLEE
jgi:sulfur-oxidizing protein SoxY